MGAWMYVKPRLQTALRELTDCAVAPRLNYVGRPSAASPGDITAFLQHPLSLLAAASFVTISHVPEQIMAEWSCICSLLHGSSLKAVPVPSCGCIHHSATQLSVVSAPISMQATCLLSKVSRSRLMAHFNCIFQVGTLQSLWMCCLLQGFGMLSDACNHVEAARRLSQPSLGSAHKQPCQTHHLTSCCQRNIHEIMK